MSYLFFSAALKVIKNEIVSSYHQLEQTCFMETGKRYLSSNSEAEKIEIANAIGLKVETIATRVACNSNSSPSNSKRANSLQIHTQEISQLNEEIRRNSNAFKTYGRLQLQYARYAEECREFSTNSLVAVYKAVKIACPHWEEGHFASGEFFSNLVKEYEKLMITKIGSQTSCIMCKPEEIIDLKGRIIGSYVESLKHGYQFVSVSLPMMLNTWVDLG